MTEEKEIKSLDVEIDVIAKKVLLSEKTVKKLKMIAIDKDIDISKRNEGRELGKIIDDAVAKYSKEYFSKLL